MKRPIGVILAAIVLSLIAFFQLLGAGLMAFTATMLHSHAGTSAVRDASIPDWMHFVILALSLFPLAIAAWAISTVVGILRLHNWGRISILIIGGCMAALGLMGLLGGVTAATVLRTMPVTQPQPSPFMMHLVLIFTGLVYGLILAVGVSWLIYFNLRATKAVFVPPALSPTVQSDGTVLPYAALPQAPGHFPPAPMAITIIGWFCLVSSLCCLLFMLIPFPAFFLGFILNGIGKYLLYLTFAALAGCSGWGLLHLRESGRRVVIAYLCLGIVQTPLWLTPWFWHRQEAYMNSISQSMVPTSLPPGVQPTKTYFIVAAPHFHMALMIIGAVFALAFNLFLLLLLHRHRHAFRQADPEPV